MNTALETIETESFEEGLERERRYRAERFEYRTRFYDRFTSESQMQDYSQRFAKHWFDADAKRFFKSRVGAIFHGASPADYNIFISSEPYSYSTRRRYTVRQLQIDGGVESLSAFQCYTSSASARRAILKYLADATPFL